MTQLVFYISKYLIFITPLFALYYVWKHDNQKHAIKDAIVMFIVAVIAWLCADTIKNILKIPRPIPASDVLLQGESLYSFPSGHTTFLLALATVFYYHHRPFAYTIALIGVLVGLSRVYMQVHTLIDIAGGIGLGILCGVLGHKLYNYLKKDNY